MFIGPHIVHVAGAGKVESRYGFAVLHGVLWVAGVVHQEQVLVAGEVTGVKHGFQQALHCRRPVTGDDEYAGWRHIGDRWCAWRRQALAHGFSRGQQAVIAHHFKYI